MNSRCSASADLCNSVPGGYYADPDTYGNNGSGDGPGDDPGDDPRDDDDDEDDEDWVDAEGDLDPNMAILNNLAVTVSRLSHSTCRNNELSSSQVKVWDPDTFDGTDPKKLWTFLVQCELVYSDCPKAFQLDRSKITFTQSYLKGMALEWFEPDLLDTSDPANCLCLGNSKGRGNPWGLGVRVLRGRDGGCQLLTPRPLCQNPWHPCDLWADIPPYISSSTITIIISGTSMLTNGNISYRIITHHYCHSPPM